MDKEQARYIIGIDLGTTNSCVAYVDTDLEKNPSASISLFSIPQVTASGQMEHFTSLPSYYYFAHSNEFPDGSLDLPWATERDFVVGNYAKDLGAKRPAQLIHAAKSWLCNGGADRHDKILPLEAEDATCRLSPVEVTAHYLRHIKDAWNYLIAKDDLESEFDQQEIILTVPASFDEVARRLTIEAAQKAGFGRMTLLEEPQAAFYHWIAEQGKDWKTQVKAGDRIVVCDVGGGTSDFSLIEMQEDVDKRLTFQRMAVGRHLLLGGENMDMALCHYVEAKVKEEGKGELNPDQWLQLKHLVRQAKEKVLDPQHPGNMRFTFTLQGRGQSVVGGSLSISISRNEMEELLLKGFFVQSSFEDSLQHKKLSAVRRMGLPFEAEPAVTKHLASFFNVTLNGVDPQAKPIDYLFFNGGSMKPQAFQKSIISAFALWQGRAPEVLSSSSLDQSVAKGAAYFAKAKRGLGEKIRAGLARAYYLVVASGGEKRALTLLSRGSEEDAKYVSERSFTVLPNVPVSFELLTSETRLDDKPGDLLDLNEEEFSRLPVLQTLLRFGKKNATAKGKTVSVTLEIERTEIGILELYLSSLESDHRWKLDFQLRTAAGQDDSIGNLLKRQNDELFEEGHLVSAESLIRALFDDSQKASPQKAMVGLEAEIGLDRKQWSPSILRGMWPSLMNQGVHRNLTEGHDQRWWHLAGFFLRPGFGAPLDDFRIKDLWKEILGDRKKVLSRDGYLARLICYRRIAGGLNKGQQMQLVSDILQSLLDQKTGNLLDKRKLNAYEYSEKIRALGSMERLDLKMKMRIGDFLMDRICAGEAEACDYWALGRLAARHLLYGTAAYVVPRKQLALWLERLLMAENLELEHLAFALGLMAKRTDQRELNLPQHLVKRIEQALRGTPYLERLRELMDGETALTQDEQNQIFGENLPAGLILQ